MYRSFETVHPDGLQQAAVNISAAIGRIAEWGSAHRSKRLPAAVTAMVLSISGCATPGTVAAPNTTPSVGISLTSTPEVTPTPTASLPSPAETTPATPTPEETTPTASATPTSEQTKKTVTYSKEAKKVLKKADLSWIRDLPSHTREIFAAEVIANYYDELTAAIENDEKIPQDLREHWKDSLVCKQDAVCTDNEYRGNVSGFETAEEIVRVIQAERLVAFKLREIAGKNIALRFRTAVAWYDHDIIESMDENIDLGYPILERDLYMIRHGAKYPSWLEAVEPENGEHETYTCRNLTFAPGEQITDAYIPQLARAFLVLNTGKNMKGKHYEPFYMTVGLLWPLDPYKDPPRKFYVIESSNANPKLNTKRDRIGEGADSTCVYEP